jgi:hypothetical protein
MPENERILEERYYTVAEIAKKLNVCRNTVRSLFDDEPGVIRIGHPSRREGRQLKRRYSILRIPESVLLRVMQERLVNKRPAEPVRGNTLSGRRDLHAAS